MHHSQIEFLKQSIDKAVEIETRCGERLVAKILFVIHDEEYDEHEIVYEVLSSNMLDSYQHRENSVVYVLDLNDIVSVKPHRS